MTARPKPFLELDKLILLSGTGPVVGRVKVR
jgi:hypothetical protein